MLSLSAFNALLKILEEPPEHILFILATTELHKVPATIQGRCQKFLFKRLSPDTIKTRLDIIASREGLNLTADAAIKLASLADGSMRDGISLLDQCAAFNVNVSDRIIDLQHVLDTVGLVGQHELLRLAGAISDRDIQAGLDILDTLYKDGKDMASLLNEMTGLTRDLLVFKIAQDSVLIGSNASSAELSALSKKLTPERLFFCLEVFKDALSGLSRGGSSKLAVEICLIRVCDERLSGDMSALISRISRLESTAPQATHENSAPQVRLESTVPQATLEAEEVSSVVSEVADEVSESGDFWADTLAYLSDHPSVRALLNDSSKVQVKQDGNELVIGIADSFNADMIESEYMVFLKEAARKALGRDVVIRIETGIGDTEENKRSKLESLSAFGIVNFE
jgi:DNA polymerase-3 subunit gamma/tau